jgi:hypothetical protein
MLGNSELMKETKSRENDGSIVCMYSLLPKVDSLSKASIALLVIIIAAGQRLASKSKVDICAMVYVSR